MNPFGIIVVGYHTLPWLRDKAVPWLRQRLGTNTQDPLVSHARTLIDSPPTGVGYESYDYMREARERAETVLRQAHIPEPPQPPAEPPVSNVWVEPWDAKLVPGRIPEDDI
jgi:hypothetical protein